VDGIVLAQRGEITKPGASVHCDHLDVRQGHGPAQDHTTNTP
jgi:hypothetical protein